MSFRPLLSEKQQEKLVGKLKSLDRLLSNPRSEDPEIRLTISKLRRFLIQAIAAGQTPRTLDAVKRYRLSSIRIAHLENEVICFVVQRS